MGSAHQLAEMNIWASFNGKGSGEMEQTPTLRINVMTLNCDLDLESA